MVSAATAYDSSAIGLVAGEVRERDARSGYRTTVRSLDLSRSPKEGLLGFDGWWKAHRARPDREEHGPCVSRSVAWTSIRRSRGSRPDGRKRRACCPRNARINPE